MGSPWWAVALGVVLAGMGGASLAADAGTGGTIVACVLLGLASVLIQFGVIAAGVEYGLRRVREDDERVRSMPPPQAQRTW